MLDRGRLSIPGDGFLAERPSRLLELFALAAREVFLVPASIPAWAVVLSLASSGGAGLVFGIYPAARASKLDPVEAMRTE